MLSPEERRTLKNVSNVVRTLGDTPLAANFDALCARLSAITGEDALIAAWLKVHRARIMPDTAAGC